MENRDLESNGEKLFDFYVSKGGEYSQLLLTAFSVIGEDLFPMLLECEKTGKKIVLLDDPEFKDCDDQPFKIQVQYHRPLRAK